MQAQARSSALRPSGSENCYLQNLYVPGDGAGNPLTQAAIANAMASSCYYDKGKQPFRAGNKPAKRGYRAGQRGVPGAPAGPVASALNFRSLEHSRQGANSALAKTRQGNKAL